MNEQHNTNRIAALISHQEDELNSRLLEFFFQNGYQTQLLSNPSAFFKEAELEHFLEESNENQNLSIVCLLMPSSSNSNAIDCLSQDAWDRDLIGYLTTLFRYAQIILNECIAFRQQVLFLPIMMSNTQSGMIQETLESSCYALVRSIAKEYGAKGMCCNLISASDSKTVLAYVRLLSGKGANFITGEFFRESL